MGIDANVILFEENTADDPDADGLTDPRMFGIR